MTPNPLLDFSGLPRFDAIRPEHVAPAIDTLLANARATVDTVATDTRPATWETVALPLDAAFDRIQRAWGTVGHLNAVVSTPALRDAYNASLPAISAFYADVGQDERLFARYRALAAGEGFAALDAPRRKVIANELRDFRLGGAELAPDAKARFKALKEELAQLTSKFDDNVLDATNAWSLVIDGEAELAGVPADVLAEARNAAAADSRAGWKLTLRMPCFLP